ncbi:MAG: hypothetical protein ACR2OJ_01935 [Hyphomicrobiales bacterium]
MAIALSFLLGSAVQLVLLAAIGYVSKNLWVVFIAVLVLTALGTVYLISLQFVSLMFALALGAVFLLMQHMIASQFHLYFKGKRQKSE